MAIGPILGRTIVKNVGYGGLGLAALAIDVLAIALFAGMMGTSRRTAAVA